MLAAIVARSRNNVIGAGNDLPWYLPADLRRFKEITTGHAVVMGRKTADSIIARLGHGLPNRENIVITRDEAYSPEGFTVVHSIDEAVQCARGEAFILGGAQIYEQALPYCDKLYITEVDAAIDGDVYFPELKSDEWNEVHREAYQKDEKNQYDYSFVIFDRVK